MALSIKNQEAERLARQLAREAGETITEAIEHALQERLARLKKRQRSRILKEKLRDILLRIDAMPVLDTRSADEIIGYDEHGIPR